MSFNLANRCTVFYIFDWEVCRLSMRERVKTLNDNGLRIWIFSQKLPFSVEKNVSKTYLGSTIHYTYTSYNKYFRLLWFQRSCDSIKSVSSFSSLDICIFVPHWNATEKQYSNGDLFFVYPWRFYEAKQPKHQLPPLKSLYDFFFFKCCVHDRTMNYTATTLFHRYVLLVHLPS